MSSRTTLLAIAILAASASAASADALDGFRQAAQTVCVNDVLSLCGDYVPDEAQIMGCMQRQRRQLSLPCRQAFDAGMKEARKQHLH